MMSRGDRNEASYLSTANRRDSLKTLVEAIGERIVREEPKRVGWKEREFSVRRRGDAECLAIAGRLRLETALTPGRIADRLNLGSPKSSNAQINRWMKSQKAARVKRKNVQL